MEEPRTKIGQLSEFKLEFAALFPKLKPGYGRIRYNMQMAGGHYTGTPTSWGKDNQKLNTIIDLSKLSFEYRPREVWV